MLTCLHICSHIHIIYTPTRIRGGKVKFSSHPCFLAIDSPLQREWLQFHYVSFQIFRYFKCVKMFCALFKQLLGYHVHCSAHSFLFFSTKQFILELFTNEYTEFTLKASALSTLVYLMKPLLLGIYFLPTFSLKSSAVVNCLACL